jgi:O-antigen ligase
MQNNPNALGHTCAVAVALIYFWYFWKRNTEKRIIGAVLMFIVLYCVYSTQSKGSYIVSGLTLLSSLLFGRSKIFKVVAVGLALGLGGTALSQLPRMQTLTRKEEGVQGRLMAWEMARVAMYNNPHGVGWDKFVAVFLWEGEYVTKATHSSYVQIGAALGKPGLFLYMGLLWCGFRAIMFTKVRSDQELRVQGMLYAIFVPFCLSNWMIDRAYHTEFFTMLAAIAAFHRAVGLRIPSKLEAETQPASKVPVGSPSPQPDFVLSPVTDPSLQVALAHAASSNITLQANQPIAWNRGGPMVFPEPVNAEEQRAAQIQQDVKKAWRRIGLIDIGMAYLLYLGVIEAWEYIIKNF